LAALIAEFDDGDDLTMATIFCPCATARVMAEPVEKEKSAEPAITAFKPPTPGMVTIVASKPASRQKP
jgi:hypothetical protein